MRDFWLLTYSIPSPPYLTITPLRSALLLDWGRGEISTARPTEVEDSLLDLSAWLVAEKRDDRGLEMLGTVLGVHG
ncbi:hypothetical protein Tco_0969567 [Tanacetum coccineum]